MIGAFITAGAENWQIFQQEKGFARITLSGQWQYQDAASPQVYVCVKKEDTGEPIIWWTKCIMNGSNWSIALDVPAGGLYNIESCLVPDRPVWTEWAIRGDMISHIGVGDLYVIAGQSNSAGYGKDFVYDPCELGVHILKNDGYWHLATHPLQDSTGAVGTPLNMDTANTGHSLYLSFAKYLKRELNYPIGLIQTAKGGSQIDAWSANGGELYENMMARIQSSGGAVKGIVWYQGCSDATGELCPSYSDKFMAWLNALRTDLQSPQLPVFVFQLNRCYSPKTEDSDYAWGMIREQQRRFDILPHVYVIPTTDSVTSDGCGHNSAKSNLVLGERLAKVALTHLYGKTFLCDAPNIARAVQTGDDQILLYFDRIYDKLETFGCTPDKLAFAVEDENGLIPIKSYALQTGSTLLLILERAPGNTPCVHCGYEQDMQKVIPVDFATHLPILSFYRFPVENMEAAQ